MDWLRWFLVTCILITFVGCESNDATGDSEDVNTTVLIESTLLGEGKAPVSGMDGEKRMVTIGDQDTFSTEWAQYSSESAPDVDFQTETVLLYDMGMIDENACVQKLAFSSLWVEDLNNSIAQVHVRLTKLCPLSSDVMCMAVVMPARPFIFVSIPKYNDYLWSEELVYEPCE